MFGAVFFFFNKIIILQISTLISHFFFLSGNNGFYAFGEAWLKNHVTWPKLNCKNDCSFFLFVMLLVHVVIVGSVDLFLCWQISQRTCSVAGMWQKYIGLCKRYESGVICLLLLPFIVWVYYCNKNSLSVHRNLLFCEVSIRSITYRFRSKVWSKGKPHQTWIIGHNQHTYMGEVS